MSIGEFAHPELLNPTQDVDPIILEMQKYIPEDATIFEYGTGKGRNAIPLARVWYSIFIQDKSPEYLREIQSLNISNIHIEDAWDASQHILSNDYDVFLCIRLLHFLSVSDAIELMRKMQKHTKKGWLNVLNFFTDETQHKPEFFFPSVEKILSLYAGWHVLFESDIKISEANTATNWRRMFQKSILFQKNSR